MGYERTNTGLAGSEAMSRLQEALGALDLEADVDWYGRWAEHRGDRCSVYVYEATRGVGYYTWCGCPEESTVEFYPDPVEAIRVGLRRAARRTTAEATDAAGMEGGGQQLIAPD